MVLTHYELRLLHLRFHFVPADTARRTNLESRVGCFSMGQVVCLMLAATHLEVGAAHIEVVFRLLIQFWNLRVCFAWITLHTVAVLVTALKPLCTFGACCYSSMSDLNVRLIRNYLSSWVELIITFCESLFF